MALFSKREKVTTSINRILIVEDEPLVAFDNEYLLQDAGYLVVASVDTVDDAIRTIHGQPLHLVLADVRLSDGGTGLDVAHAARDAGVPLIFVTGACPVEAQELAVGCLAKPYTPRDLLAAIDAVDASMAGRKPKRMPRGFTLF
ncbi:response regulator [Sphingomonas sp. BIUV-7]|uniref:Response regulator n=1 Tax=Sphingomonas natans TaxID=3063330 RepID=A0ABT8YG00_9SPHN|nr:response regulator [Sphingomonas sp. BIUV-7]MDO6416878.1 response regulator [Sphingomonas sp. BIUV-7]